MLLKASSCPVLKALWGVTILQKHCPKTSNNPSACQRSCCGLLHVRKLPGLGAFARPAPEAPLLLLRHRRTRLAIEELQIDPDAEAAEAAASGGRPPSAGLCGGGPPGAASALDF